MYSGQSSFTLYWRVSVAPLALGKATENFYKKTKQNKAKQKNYMQKIFPLIVLV